MTLRLVILTFIVASVDARASGESARPPAILESVGITQHLGAALPLDLPFRDESGHTLPLSAFFGRRPVLLNFVYYKCPGLCTQVLNDLSRTLNGLAESAGEQFDV